MHILTCTFAYIYISIYEYHIAILKLVSPRYSTASDRLCKSPQPLNGRTIIANTYIALTMCQILF